MKFALGLCVFLGAVLAVVLAQRGNFRQFNNNNNFNNNFNNFNNNNNFRPQQNNNFRPQQQQQNFRPQQQQQNFRQFNNNNNNFQTFQPQQQQRQQPQQQQQQQQRQFDFGLDTSDGRFAKFNGPVKGLPHGHGGGRYGMLFPGINSGITQGNGAADCLLCPNGF